MVHACEPLSLCHVLALGAISRNRNAAALWRAVREGWPAASLLLSLSAPVVTAISRALGWYRRCTPRLQSPRHEAGHAFCGWLESFSTLLSMLPSCCSSVGASEVLSSLPVALAQPRYCTSSRSGQLDNLFSTLRRFSCSPVDACAASGYGATRF